MHASLPRPLLSGRRYRHALDILLTRAGEAGGCRLGMDERSLREAVRGVAQAMADRLPSSAAAVGSRAAAPSPQQQGVVEPFRGLWARPAAVASVSAPAPVVPSSFPGHDQRLNASSEPLGKALPAGEAGPGAGHAVVVVQDQPNELSEAWSDSSSSSSSNERSSSSNERSSGGRSSTDGGGRGSEGGADAQLELRVGAGTVATLAALPQYAVFLLAATAAGR